MKILLIAPAFYGYHHSIVAEMEQRGHQVEFHADRPGRWLYSPARRLPRRLGRAIFDAFLRRITQRIGGKNFDLVALINGKLVTTEFVAALRASQPKARFVMYQWDGLKEVDYRKLLPLFDAAATFDPVDARALGIAYEPTFYVPAYHLPEAPAAPEWDLVFVASYNETRYRAMQMIRDQCAAAGIRLRHYLYIAPVDFIKLKLLSANPPKRKDVKFRKLSTADIVDMYRGARAILDIEDLKQSGLTIRTFEALATGRLLVTTNPNAARLLPELAERIVTIDREHPELTSEQLRSPPGWSEELNKYSLERWVDRLLAM